MSDTEFVNQTYENATMTALANTTDVEIGWALWFCSNKDAKGAIAEALTDLVHVIASPFCILCNVLVIYIAVQYIDFSARLNQWFVMNMTIADLIYTIIYMSSKLFLACFNFTMCKFYYMITWWGNCSSVMALLMLNIDKFLSIHFPLHYHQYQNEWTVGLQISIVNVVIIGYSLYLGLGPPLFKNDRPDGIECDVGVQHPYYLIMYMVFVLIPILISLGISIYIFMVAQRASTSHFQGSFDGSCNRKVETDRDKLRQQLKKRIIFVFSSTVATAVCFLPYRLAFTGFTVCLETCRTSNDGISAYMNTTDCNDHCGFNSTEFTTFLSILWWGLPIGTVINPVITLMTQRIYRERLELIMAKHLSWLPCIKPRQNPAMKRDSHITGTSLMVSSSVRRPKTKHTRVNHNIKPNTIEEENVEILPNQLEQEGTREVNEKERETKDLFQDVL